MINCRYSFVGNIIHVNNNGEAYILCLNIVYILYPIHEHNNKVNGCKQNNSVERSYNDLI